MSAIIEEPDGAFPEPVKVLITTHEKMDTLDALGPLEVFMQALHDKNNEGMVKLWYFADTKCHSNNIGRV
jgi:hypothetical protein